MTQDTMPLAGQFPDLTRSDWAAMAAKALNRGRPENRQLDAEAAEAALRTHLVGGIDISPLYELDEVRPLGRPGFMPFTRGSGLRDPEQAWDVRALHEDPDRDATRQAVLLDLERGVTSLWVEVGTAGVAPADLSHVLADVMLDLAPVVVSSQDDQVAAAHALREVLLAAADPSGTRGNLGIDPLHLALRTGAPVDLAPIPALAPACLDQLPGVRTLTVDTRAVHEAGAGPVEELGYAVAAGVVYLRALEAAGIGPDRGTTQIEFRVVADADQFTTVAKLRALRRMWARVGQVCQVPESARGALVHAVTSYRMATRDDPWNNIMRGTVACFAAAVGGAEAITVLPFDVVAGQPDTLGRRIARNTQLVLAEESNLGRVTDPAGGSTYVEELTDQLAVRAWAAFQRIEAGGGLAALVDNGGLAEQLAGARAERATALAQRSVPITGVSMFPLVGEQPLARTARPQVAGGGLPVCRDSQIFEQLRDRAASASGRVALLTLGTRRDFGARESFAANLLGVAGLDAARYEAAGAAQVADALDGQVPELVVVCSSPAVNAVEGAGAVAALRAAGVGAVHLAGNADELGDGAGLDGTLYNGMDVVAVLGQVLDTLGAAR